ncbi:hypothetical protein, partial [Streptomyces virginiae]
MSDVDKGGFISKVIGPKKRWWAYKARAKQLPEAHRPAVEAVERYLMHFVPTDADSNASTVEDLAEFARNYSEGGCVPARARKQLTEAIARAEEAERE